MTRAELCGAIGAMAGIGTAGLILGFSDGYSCYGFAACSLGLLRTAAALLVMFIVALVVAFLADEAIRRLQ